MPSDPVLLEASHVWPPSYTTTLIPSSGVPELSVTTPETDPAVVNTASMPAVSTPADTDTGVADAKFGWSSHHSDACALE